MAHAKRTNHHRLKPLRTLRSLILLARTELWFRTLHQRWLMMMVVVLLFKGGGILGYYFLVLQDFRKISLHRLNLHSL